MPLRALPGLTPKQRYDAFDNDGQLIRGLKSGVAGSSAGSFANQALQEELAANALRESGAAEAAVAEADAKWKSTLGTSQQIQQDAEIYAPRVRSLRDVRGIGDGLDFAAGAFGSGVASMAPTLAAGAAAGLLTRSPKAAFAAAAAAGYQMEKGEAVAAQYADPVLAATSARDRDNAGMAKAGVNAVLEAAVPASLAGSIFRRGGKGLLTAIGRSALAEGATEGLQTYSQHLSEKWLDPNQKLDPWELADSIASGALTGGGVHAATSLPGAVLDRVAPVAPTDPNAPVVPKDPKKLSRTDRFLDALGTSSNPITAIRSAFSTPASEAAADLLPDTQDHDVLNAADPEAAMRQREATRAANATRNASVILNDPGASDTLKEQVLAMDLNDPANHTKLAEAVVAHDAGARVFNAVDDAFNWVSEKIGSLRKPGGPKNNLQNFGDGAISPLVDLMAQRLGPKAGEAPTVARQLLAVASMFSGKEPLTRGVARRLMDLSSVADEEVLNMVSSITGSEGMQSTIERIQAIPSATNDVGRNSFFESVLKVPLSNTDKRNLAGIIDEAGLKLKTQTPEKKAATLAGLSKFFGNEDTARTVVEYYGNRRRAAFKAEAEANKLPEDRPKSPDNTLYRADVTQTPTSELDKETATEFGVLTEKDSAPLPSYKFRDAKSMRPFRAFARRGVNEDGMRKRSKESTLAGLELRKGSPDSARVRPITYSQYVEDTGKDPEIEMHRITDDIHARMAEHKKHKGREKQLEELQGELDLIDTTYLQSGNSGGSKGVLDLYEVLQTSQSEKNDTVADDDTVAAYSALLGSTRDPRKANPNLKETAESINAENKAINDTKITFKRVSGADIALSAESMWKSQGDKEGSGKGEPERKRIRRLFNEAVSAMLARPDIKGIVGVKGKNLPEGVLLDRKSGIRTPAEKTDGQKLAAKLQRRANAKENARRDRLDAEEKFSEVKVAAEASARRTPETRTNENKQKFLDEQKQADAKEEAIAKARQANLSRGPKARRAELQERLDEFEAVLTEDRTARQLDPQRVTDRHKGIAHLTSESAAKVNHIDGIKSTTKDVINNDRRDVAEQLDEVMQPLRDAAVLAGQRVGDAKAALDKAKQNNAPDAERYKLQTAYDLEREALADIRDTLEDMEGLQFEDSWERNDDDRKGATTEQALGTIGHKGLLRTTMNEQDSDDGKVRFYEDDTGAGIGKERGTRTGGAKRVAGKPYSAPDNAEQPSARQRGDKAPLPVEPLSSTKDNNGISPSDMAGSKTAEGGGKAGTLEKLIASGDARVAPFDILDGETLKKADVVVVGKADGTKLLAGTMSNGATYINKGKLIAGEFVPYFQNSPMLMRVMDAMGITPEQLDAQLGNNGRRASFLRDREYYRQKEKSLWSETRATFLALSPAELEALGVKPLGPKPKPEGTTKYSLQEPASTAPGPKKKAKSKTSPKDEKSSGQVSAKDQAAITAEIHRIRGPDIVVAFKKFLRGVGQYDISEDHVKRLIQISLNAGNAMSTGRHEAFHDFFALLPESAAGRSIKKDLMDAANTPRIKAAIHKLLEGHPRAQKQAATDMEERLAYMFQFYMETDANGQRMLHLGPTAGGIFARIAQLFREIFNIVGKETRAADLLTALNDGKFANSAVSPDVVNEVLADMPANRGINKLDKAAPAITAMLRNVVKTAPDRLRAFHNDHLNTLADMFSSETGKIGFIQRKLQQENIWINKFDKILTGTTAEQRRDAIENLQAMKDPQPGLEKAISDLIQDLHDYMTKAKVKTRSEITNPETGEKTAMWVALRHVKNYFPRNFDRNKILADVPGFSALLNKYGAFNSAQIEAVIKQLTHGTGQDDLVEDKHSLGYTPFASATNARKLTFIRKKNAAEFAKFQEKDITDTLTGYIRQAVHRAEYARSFDNDGKKIQDLINKSGVTAPEDLASIFHTVQGLEGSLGNNMSSSTKELLGAVLTLENVVILPMVMFSQLVDPIYLAARTGNLRDAGDAYVTALKRFMRMEVDGEQMANDLGVIAKDSVLEAMGTSFGSVQMGKTARWVSGKFFKYNGLEGWNNSMRIAATKIGARYLIANKLNTAALEELGLKPKDVLLDENGELDITSPKVKEAMFRFVDQAVLRPSASNRPVWMSDPRWVLFSHLKQFTFAMHNVVMKRATAQMADGNMKPWALLLLAVPISIAASVGKFSITGNVPGWGFMEYLKHGIERSGLLGIGDFGSQALQDGGRGNMPGESLLGPTMGHLMTILRYISGDARTDLGKVVDRTIPGAKFF